MGYAGARGGLEAILAAEALVRGARDGDPSMPLGTDQITGRMRLAVDRVMGEGGLYHQDSAADALRQAEGDVIEAAHLVRAAASTLPRLAVSEPIDPDAMTILRRVVPAHRDPEGPQLLGRTSDYIGRVLERGVAPSTAPTGTAVDASAAEPARRPRRFSASLRELGVLIDRRRTDGSDPEPFDLNRHSPRPPAPRSALLSSMARAETGSLVGLWYSTVRGPDGKRHEVTLGEVRHGRVTLRVTHPHTGNPVGVGEIRLTEAESIDEVEHGDADGAAFDLGYGLCLGHNERKAIAMANLDLGCRARGPADGLSQQVLLTTDGLDSCGFLEHLKLPHYVSFRSKIDRLQAVRASSADTSSADTSSDTMESATR